MFLLFPLLRNLAARSRRAVLLVCGLLFAAGAAVALVGLALHTPQITRVGIIVFVLAALLTPALLRAQRAAPTDADPER